MSEAILRLLIQARAWFRPHPQRADAVSVEADPREVRDWMETVDRETGPAPLDGGELLGHDDADRDDDAAPAPGAP